MVWTWLPGDDPEGGAGVRRARRLSDVRPGWMVANGLGGAVGAALFDPFSAAVSSALGEFPASAMVFLGFARGRNATRDRSRTVVPSAADLVDPIPLAGRDVGHRCGSGRGRRSVRSVSRRCRSEYRGGVGGFQWFGGFRGHSVARPAWTGHLGLAVGTRQCDRTGCRSPSCWYLHILFHTSDWGCSRGTVRTVGQVGVALFRAMQGLALGIVYGGITGRVSIQREELM